MWSNKKYIYLSLIIKLYASLKFIWIIITILILVKANQVQVRWKDLEEVAKF